jgi:uncharacterized protein (DUF1697 family)
MVKYVSFLRGINVGGHKLIKMDVLKDIFLSAGLKDVKTFIQSGNVIFSSEEKDSKKLNSKIKKQLLKFLGYEVEVFTRSENELLNVMGDNPFKDINTDKTIKVYISFLSSITSDDNKKEFESLSYEAEIFKVIKYQAYTQVYKDKIKTKAVFANNILEKKLRVTATTRDLNTLNKIMNLL